MNEQELKESLEENKKLAHENNKILKKMRRGKRWSNFFKLVGLIVIIGLGVLGYQYARPYIQQAQSIYESFQEGVGDIKEAQESLSEGANKMQGVLGGSSQN